MHADVALSGLGKPGSWALGPDIGGRVAAGGGSHDRSGLRHDLRGDGSGGSGGSGGSSGSGASSGFDTFYREHYEGLVRLGFLLTLSEDVARDLVHDVFVRVYRRFDGLDDPLPYLRRSVVNASRSWHRRRRLEQTRARAAEHPPDVAFEADELFDVLARLPSRQRAAIVLRFYEQMSDAEIAVLLQCRPGTVASLVHRGCTRLRHAITDRDAEPEPDAGSDAEPEPDTEPQRDAGPALWLDRGPTSEVDGKEER
jgi:RNA polymerase sigma factor (sigma-70 family)